jgi:GMP synthase-like glutamine amidotransferase
MHVLIVNNSYTPADYSALEVYGTVSYVQCKDLCTADFGVLLEGKTALLLTGGPQHVYELEKYPELYHELFLLDAAVKRQIKVIGICLGFQIINHYFGNKVVRLFEPCIGHGYLDASSFLPGDDTALQTMDVALLSTAFSFHYDGVLENTHPDLFVVARSRRLDNGGAPIYFIRHRFLPIYAIQSHPDGDYDEIRACLTKYGVGAEGVALTSREEFKKIWENFFQLLK